MPTLASGLRISSQQLGPDETIPQTHQGPHGPSMIRSVKRAIVDISGIHSTFALCSFTDVRDGFARDCPLRHPVLPMLALRDRSRVAPDFLVGFRRFQRSRARHRGGESRLGRGGGRCPRDRLASQVRWSGVLREPCTTDPCQSSGRHPPRLSLAERMHHLDTADGPPRRGELLEPQTASAGIRV